MPVSTTINFSLVTFASHGTPATKYLGVPDRVWGPKTAKMRDRETLTTLEIVTITVAIAMQKRS